MRFAEKVLGLRVGFPSVRVVLSGREALDLWYIETEDGMKPALPHYTRSLDAAWEGVEALAAKYRDSTPGNEDRYEFSVELGYRSVDVRTWAPLCYIATVYPDGVDGNEPGVYALVSSDERILERLEPQFTGYRDDKDKPVVMVDPDPHPAEALCLACLRAVGVPEEDLK